LIRSEKTKERSILQFFFFFSFLFPPDMVFYSEAPRPCLPQAGIGRSFPGTQWRAGCEQMKSLLYCAPEPRLSRFGGKGHLPVTISSDSNR